jgi:hypothetical protein
MLEYETKMAEIRKRQQDKLEFQKQKELEREREVQRKRQEVVMRSMILTI